MLNMRPATIVCATVFSIAAMMPRAMADDAPKPAQGQGAQQVQPSQTVAPQEQKVLIAAVQVVGNQKIPTETIMSAISIKAGSEIPVSKLQETANADMNAIVALGTIADVGANLEQYKNGALLVFKVQENPVLTGVEFAQNTLITSKDLAASLISKSGDVINRNTIKSDMEALSALYVKQGYNLSDVGVALGPDNKLIYTMLETKVGKIVVEGNTKTKTNVITRELKSKVGSALNSNDVKAELRRIFNLGFFEEVTPVFENTDKPDEVAYKIQVKERKAGTYGGAVTYGPSDGLMGQLYITEPNLMGNGQTLSLNAEAGLSKSKTFEITFKEPWMWEGKSSMDFHLYSKDTRQKDYSEQAPGDYYIEHRGGGDISFGINSGEDNTINLGIGSEVTSNRNDDNSVLVLPGDGRTNYVDAGFTRDVRDNILFPKTGYRFTATTRLAGGALAGDNNFTKTQGSISGYFPVGAEPVLAVRVAGGRIWNSGELAAQERFRLGGSETLRGYDFGAFQGDSLVYTNLEFRVPVQKKGSIVLFADAGNTWTASKGETLTQLKVAAGLGARISTPIGEIRLDYGVRKADTGELVGKTHFSIGQMF